MNDFRMGQHEARIELLSNDMAEVKADVREIKNMLAEQRGERRSTAKFAAVVGATAGSALTLFVKGVLFKMGFHT